MEKLLALPYEFQIIVFAGYLAYKIATIGRSVVHRTEDFLLQVLAFGSLGRLLVASFIELLIAFGFLNDQSLEGSENVRLLVVGIGTFSAAVMIASLWRLKLQALWIALMAKFEIYRDDHEASTLNSITAARTEWIYVQLHCDDGNIYEANFRSLPKNLPLGGVKLNDDGVAMYVSSVHGADYEETEMPEPTEMFGAKITYFPRATIKRLEIGWKKR